MTYRQEHEQQIKQHLELANAQVEEYQKRLAEAQESVRDILDIMEKLGIKLREEPDPNSNVNISATARTYLKEADVRDWIKNQSAFDEAWTLEHMATELDTSRQTARRWTRHFVDKGMIEKHGDAYRYVKPTGGPTEKPRGSPPPSAVPNGAAAPHEVRGRPVQGTGNGRGLPEHVKRVKPHLKSGVQIKKKGNEHFFFHLGKQYTWTSHSPRNIDDEYAQLVRRLKNEGMWVA